MNLNVLIVNEIGFLVKKKKKKKKVIAKSKDKEEHNFGLFSLLNGISTFVVYLMPKSSL